jgi:hypothetical protein
MPRTTIDNTESVLDSRIIIERIEDIEQAREAYIEENAGEDASADVRTAQGDAWALFFPEDAAELAALSKLAAEGEGYAPDWHHGEVLIRDDYFTAYAKEMLEDCGTIPRDLPNWVEIDWEATARNVRVDYAAVDFDGVTYWIR